MLQMDSKYGEDEINIINLKFSHSQLKLKK